jgi:large subunit ribosomal protein L11
MKSPPASILVKKACGLPTSGKPGSGSKTPNKQKVGKLTWDQVREIAKEKMGDMNAAELEAAARSIAGTARSMGVDVVD